MKRTTDVTDKRLIDVLCEVDYDVENKITTITAIIEPEKTAQLTSRIFRYDICNKGENSNEEFTPFLGDIFLLGDIRTPFDGFPLPDDYERIILLDPTDFNDNTLLLFKTGEGFVPLTLDALETLLQNANYSIFAPEFDPYNPDAVSPNVDGLTRRVEEVNTNILLELDEEQNITFKEI
jgi:hypothetical protein